MTNDYWLEAKNVSCIKNGYEVVKDLNLKLRYGENVILLGPNGSGKSSLLELINRNIYPVIKKDTVFKIFNKELINIWELRKRISVVNYDVKSRINPNLKVIDLIISGLYGKYCKIDHISDEDVSLVENHINRNFKQYNIDEFTIKENFGSIENFKTILSKKRSKEDEANLIAFLNEIRPINKIIDMRKNNHQTTIHKGYVSGSS